MTSLMMIIVPGRRTRPEGSVLHERKMLPTIPASDLARARAWYVDKLELATDQRSLRRCSTVANFHGSCADLITLFSRDFGVLTRPRSLSGSNGVAQDRGTRLLNNRREGVAQGGEAAAFVDLAEPWHYAAPRSLTCVELSHKPIIAPTV